MALTTSDFEITLVTKKNHFLQLLIFQDGNNIFEVYQSLNPTTGYVLLTGALGTLQELILRSPESPKKNHFLQLLISQARNNIF